jgi:hypothetical protein
MSGVETVTDPSVRAQPVGDPPVGYQYVVLRCVPRVDREEFLNVGVVVYCQALDFLRCGSRLDEARLTVFGGGLDISAVSDALAAVSAVCAGDPAAGSVAAAPPGTRFGFLAAPRSTVIQPGPVHGGVTNDPAGALESLVRSLVSSA